MKKVVKKLQNIKSNDSEEFATKGDIRHLGVIMEGMKDSISFIAETVVGLSDNLNNLSGRVDDMDKRFSSDISIIKSDISDIKFDLKRKVDRDEFVTLVKRVEKLEAKR
jgi:hypothetical protein